jgi:hypothetical protein
LRRRPNAVGMTPVKKSGSWAVYFVYAPDLMLSSNHHFTLSRLREEGFLVCVVCASPRRCEVPAGLARYCDALYWKALPGFDFSGYTIALEEIALRAPGSDVLVMNDSVFGPFKPLRPLVSGTRWDLTGFTASGRIENHIQSYAFHICAFDQQRLAAMRKTFHRHSCYWDVDGVIRYQEIPMARVAYRTMTVGSLWYSPLHSHDPTLHMPYDMLQHGYPFMKRSLLTKFAHVTQRTSVLDVLKSYGHPAPADQPTT